MAAFPKLRILFLGAALLAPLAVAAGPGRITGADFPGAAPDAAALGRLLFYDKVLSGNRNISCGTCHHHDLAGGDAVALGFGEGGAGLGTRRQPGYGPAQVHARIPRNAPALWNLGHRDVHTLFHDGRLQADAAAPGGFVSPAGETLPEGLSSILAAQALFPVTSEHEMAGSPGENPVADAAVTAADRPAAWALLAGRVAALPAYVEMARAAYPHVEAPEDITIVEIVNALGAFIAVEWQSYDSPWDAWLAGEAAALSPAQERGRDLFFGDAQCAGCHSGPLFTDQEFHAIGLPNFGPGKTLRGALGVDPGRMLTTGDPADAYRFRTPSLRNVTLTAPYGHNGAYATLKGIIAHHCHPEEALLSWRPEMAGLPPLDVVAEADFAATADGVEVALQLASLTITPLPDITESDVDDIVAFLGALTGETAGSRPLGRPAEVPSGLPVD